MYSRLIAACVLVWAGAALAGAWDTGSFDNDDALDWVWELSESDDLPVVTEALQSAVDAPAYLEAPTGSRAIAAAEVVAALKGHPRPELPEEVSAWVRAHDFAIDDDLAESARQAIANIKDVESSELAQLWSESEELLEAWHADLRNLLERLE